MAETTGLVLTAGGARAAYQAGVLLGISKLFEKRGLAESCPFPVLTGISAGAINASLLATHADNFSLGAAKLAELWGNLHSDQVIRTDFASLASLGSRWIRDLSLGGILGGVRSTYLLDSTPLRKFLSGILNFGSIRHHVEKGILRGVAISATNYKTGTAISFFDGSEDIEQWVRSSRLGQRALLKLEHVLASASIPVLFPPVLVDRCFYGDGSIRLTAPLSPAIHMGSTRIVAVGIRYNRPGVQTVEMNQAPEMKSIVLADIAGVLMNAAFFDALDGDVERLMRINQTVSLLSKTTRELHPSQLRPIPLLVIRPTEDLGQLATEQYRHFPRMLRYVLAGIGATSQQSADFMSYLAFDKAYTCRLLELGMKDVQDRAEEVEEFFFSVKSDQS